MKVYRLVGLLLLAVALAACGSPAPTTIPPTAAAATNPAPTVQPASVAEGRLLPLQVTTLSFGTGGPVVEVLVNEGDVVQAGDVIARLKSDALRAALAEAEAALTVVQAGQANYRASLAVQIAAAEAELAAAQAQAASSAAGRNHSASIVELQARLAQARYQQQQLQTALDQLGLYDRDQGTAARNVRQQLDSTLKTIAALNQQIAALQTGSAADAAAVAQIEAAAAGEAAAQAQLVQLQNEAAGKAVDPFAAQIQQAQAAVQAARLALAGTELIAPFGGTVAQLNLKAGEQIAAGAPAVVLADLSGWIIETNDLTEIKVPEIEVGQPVSIKLDALPELSLTGTVESIGAVSQLRSGDVTYPVRIKLNTTDPRLRWGMTAAVTFEK